jgi:hypothetical protein
MCCAADIIRNAAGREKIRRLPVSSANGRASDKPVLDMM